MTTPTVDAAIQFLVQKALVDGLIPWDVAHNDFVDYLKLHREYRDASYVYSIVEFDGPRAFGA